MTINIQYICMYNLIGFCCSASFTNNPLLKVLNLAENSIVIVEDLLFLPALTLLSVFDNVLHCNTSTSWLWDVPDTLDLNIDAEPCATPARLVGIAMSSINPQDLCMYNKYYCI